MGAACFKDEAAPAGGASLGAVGLHNLGNTCSLAAAVQCLMHAPPLADHFLLADWRRDLVPATRTRPWEPRVTTEFVALLRRMWLGGQAAQSPHALHHAVGVADRRFANHMEQHDAQEVLQAVLDNVHDDLNRVLRRPPPLPALDSDGRPDADVADEAWARHLAANDSVVTDTFCGQLRSSVTCCRCGYASVTFDPFLSLSVPLEDGGGGGGGGAHYGAVGAEESRRARARSSSSHDGNGGGGGCRAVTLGQALSLFTSPERLAEGDAWRCPKCATSVEAVKRMAVWRLPRVLVVHLKRFRHNRSGTARVSKVAHAVAYPVAQLEMAPFCADGSPGAAAASGGKVSADSAAAGGADCDGDGSSSRYNLFAVARHHGTVSRGHYTAVVRNHLSARWFLCDDDVTSGVDGPLGDADTGGSDDAYVLCYLRQQQPVALRPRKAAATAAQPPSSAASSASSESAGSSEEAVEGGGGVSTEPPPPDPAGLPAPPQQVRPSGGASRRHSQEARPHAALSVSVTAAAATGGTVPAKPPPRRVQTPRRRSTAVTAQQLSQRYGDQLADDGGGNDSDPAAAARRRDRRASNGRVALGVARRHRSQPAPRSSFHEEAADADYVRQPSGVAAGAAVYAPAWVAALRAGHGSPTAVKAPGSGPSRPVVRVASVSSTTTTSGGGGGSSDVAAPSGVVRVRATSRQTASLSLLHSDASNSRALPAAHAAAQPPPVLAVGDDNAVVAVASPLPSGASTRSRPSDVDAGGRAHGFAVVATMSPLQAAPAAPAPPST